MIYGIWYAEFSFPQTATAELILQREPFYPISSTTGGGGLGKGYFQRFEFYENGEFVDVYTAPCGNFGRLHRWTGTWKLVGDEQTIILQIKDYQVGKLQPSESYKKGQELQIIEITKAEIRLKFKDPGDPRGASPLWQYDRHNV